MEYFIGYEEDGEIVPLTIELCPEFNACRKNPNELRNINFFTQTFTPVELFNFLYSRRIIISKRALKLYFNAPEGIKEIRGGIAYKDSISYFEPKKIEKYFFDNIANQEDFMSLANIEFLTVAVAFLKPYFSSKTIVPEGLPFYKEQDFLGQNTHVLYSQYYELIDYLKFLESISKRDPKTKPSREQKTQINLSAKQHIGSCRVSVPKLIKYILYGEKLETDEDALNYEGLHELAMFVYSFEQSHHLEKVAEPKYQDRGVKISRTPGYASSDERDDVSSRLF